MADLNHPLLIGGSLSILAGLLHLAIIIGGPQWYQFFHAGDVLVSLARQGSPLPDIVTAGIMLVLFLWGIAAFSGAGLITPLPWLRPILIAIAGIYLLRGLIIAPLLLIDPNQADTFMIVTSAISFLIGVSYATGIRQLLWEQA
jgi:hypothetical protein